MAFLKTDFCFFLLIPEDPQNGEDYYYYDGVGVEYDDYYDNEEYSETYNYDDGTEGKVEAYHSSNRGVPLTESHP